MGIEVDETIPKTNTYDESILTPFWQEAKKLSKKRKNKLLIKILQLSFPYSFLHIKHRLIASTVLIGADPNTACPTGYTALHQAVADCTKPLTILLLEKGANPNSGLSNEFPGIRFGGWSVLHTAVEKKKKELVNLLLENGAAPNCKTAAGDTPLHFACIDNYYHIAKDLLDHGANSNEKGCDDDSALLYASGYGFDEIVKLLLEHGADPDQQSKSGRAPLLAAAEKGHPKVVTLLLQKGADANIVEREGYDAPLIKASSKGHLDVVQLLLDNGADVDKKGYGGRTALMEASEAGHKAVVKKLLQKSADPNIKCTRCGLIEYKQTALGLARNVSIARLLLKHGANPQIVLPCACEQSNERFFASALWKEENKNWSHVVRFLLNNGAKLNGKEGLEGLQVAAMGGNEKLVRLLLKRDNPKNIFEMDNCLETPLLFKVLEGYRRCKSFSVHSYTKKDMHKNVFSLLLRHGADPNSRKKFNFWEVERQTILEDAIRLKLITYARLLLEYGAYSEVYYSKNPLFAAYEQNNKYLARLLLYHGADIEQVDHDRAKKWYLKRKEYIRKKLQQKKEQDGLKFLAARTVMENYNMDTLKTTKALPNELITYTKDVKKLNIGSS